MARELSSSERWLDALAIAAAHAAACVAVRLAGFDHVSDDDFARVTIAQTFAHAPRLDPSGTSWLPFPFWTLGTLMMAVGRSLDAARALSIALASLGAALPYLALRSAGVARPAALFGTVFAFGTPWALWLGAATVPESLTASLAAAGAIGVSALAGKAPKHAAASAAALACACLSRYEVWPLAAVVALGLLARATRGMRSPRERTSLVALAFVCAAAPLAWMAWNAHAHDGPLHFFRRVSSFKRAIGDGATDPLAALLLYPRLLVTTRPEVTVPALLLLLLGPRDAERRRRWRVPLVGAAAEVLFLAYGNARDGAPAHHPERALLGAFVILALYVADAGAGLIAALPRRRAGLAAACVAILWLASVARDAGDVPGTAEAEDRGDAIARGHALAAERTEHAIVTPCAFEHFALLAAWGAPERAEVRPPREPPTPPCPDVAISGSPPWSP